jgi:hypothetical protein
VLDKATVGPSMVTCIVNLSMAAVPAPVARKWFESNKYVTRFDTHVALERVKIGLSLPIEDLN